MKKKMALFQQKRFRRLPACLAAMLSMTCLAACNTDGSMDSASAAETASSVSTDSAQEDDVFVLHDGDTLDSIVTVAEGEYLVVKSDDENQDAEVKVTGSGGFVVEKGAVLVLENVNLRSDGEERSLPVFSVSGDMIMNDGAVMNFSSTTAGFASNYGTGGIPAICVVNGTFTMNGGVISGNRNTTTEEPAFGGALRAEGSEAEIIINDGTISGNSVSSSAAVKGSLTVTANALGGAIAATEGASLTINGGELSGNTAGSHEANAEDAEYDVCSGNGGAIAVYSSASTAISSLYLNGGSIMNNNAYRTNGDAGSTAWTVNQTYGGGIFSNVYTTAVLTAGTIAGNNSDDFGGGLFLDCDKTYGGASFSNTLVTSNEASVLGGGLWFCPSGGADMFSEAKADGIAVFGNTTTRRGTDGAGDDLYVTPRSGSSGVTLTSTMPGGGSNAWYQDGGASTTRTSSSGSRYAASVSASIASVSLLKASAVVNMPTEEARDSATAAAKLVVKDNQAAYGGGIASNHYLRFGTPTPEEEAEHVTPQPTPAPTPTPTPTATPTATPESEKVSIQVNVVWIGDEGNSATVHLFANGTETANATLTAASGWTYTFTNLDRTDSSGNTITYTLTEDAIEGYESDITGDAASGFTVTNTKKIDITVTKNWVRQDGDIATGTEATVHLFANNIEVGSVTLTEANGWTYTFTNLDQADSSGDIEYTLSEDPIEGYVTEISGDAASGFIVSNIISVTVSVSKIYDGGTTIPSSVIIKLKINGALSNQSLVLSANTNWAGSFTNLPKYDVEGNLITYDVIEAAAYNANGEDETVFWTVSYFSDSSNPYRFSIVNRPYGSG